ncbi:MAG TPA: MMPL family transporter [Opitutaceae bacterium]|nr:MMPL family transporter [Opitutaceae bacterium]
MTHARRLTAALEALVFGHRRAVLAAIAALTLAMAFFASRTHIDASFLKQLPAEHPYIKTFVEYQSAFGNANRVVIALTVKHGDIFQPQFFDTLRKVTDEVFFLPGVDRASVTSLYTPNVRFVEIVEDGFAGGTVIPADFQPTPAGLEQVRQNVIKSGKVGQLVANDFTGAIVSAQLLEVDPSTGKRLNYLEVAKAIEERIRARHVPAGGEIGLGIHVIGFAKIMGDVGEAAKGVVLFFLVSIVLTAALVLIYTRSRRLTLWTILCSLVAVVWQLGLLNLLGYGIDPLSILVPFLVFAIGVSHAVQMVRAYRNEAFEGAAPVAAARAAFRTMLFPGAVALTTDTIGFLTMLLVKIQIIRELAITASLGVALIVLTNLVLLPVLLSWVQLSPAFLAHMKARSARTDRSWRHFEHLTRPAISLSLIAVGLALGAFGWSQMKNVQIGDLDAGVPELRPDSRYNLDAAAIASRFTIGVDLLSVIVETEPSGCIDFDVMTRISEFEWHVRNIPGVQSTISLAAAAKIVNAGWNEGSLKWRSLPPNQAMLAQATSPFDTASGLLNADGSVMPVIVFLQDHKAATIRRVIAAIEEFAAAHPSPRVRFRLASGNIGVMAATNQVVEQTQWPIVAWVFGSIVALCLITFRSLRATICIVLPLLIVSLLADAVMVALGIGLKPSTLPVISLGVGIGVDYGIYLFSRLQFHLEAGLDFDEALFLSFRQTGSAVIFTGLTLGIGVSTWIFSGLKYQADMGVLLTFMFIVNMLGAILLLPALARWLYARR